MIRIMYRLPLGFREFTNTFVRILNLNSNFFRNTSGKEISSTRAGFYHLIYPTSKWSEIFQHKFTFSKNKLNMEKDIVPYQVVKIYFFSSRSVICLSS